MSVRNMQNVESGEVPLIDAHNSLAETLEGLFFEKAKEYVPGWHAPWAVPGKAFFVCLTGGCLATEMRLPVEMYDYAKEKLTELFGEPTPQDSWHPSHTKGVKPLTFYLQEGKEQWTNLNTVHHINLIMMMQNTKKHPKRRSRYVSISWM